MVLYAQFKIFRGPLSIPVQKAQRTVAKQFIGLDAPFFDVSDVQVEGIHDALHQFGRPQKTDTVFHIARFFVET